MRTFLYGFMAIGMWALGAEATAEVFRCESPENGIVYQQTPCPEPEPEAEEPDEPAQAEQESTPDPVADEAAAEERPTAEVEACRQPYRDAIDAIDLEIANSYSPEQKEYYLGRLKVLTEKLRTC